MAINKQIVCLANSIKHGGRCVAGKVISDDGSYIWLRPINYGHYSSIYNERLCDGVEPNIFDIIDICFLRRSAGIFPNRHQTENWIIDKSVPWEKVRSFDVEDVGFLFDMPSVLWVNCGSTFGGLNDKVLPDFIESVSGSLFFLKVEMLKIIVSKEVYGGKPTIKLWGEFCYGNVRYRLRITDPNTQFEYSSRGDGSWDVDIVGLVVSLGEFFESANIYSKLIATVVFHL